MSKYNNLEELISFLFDEAHDIEIDDEDLTEDLRTLARKLKEEESKTHVIDGVTYVEGDRHAEVGEKIVMIDDFCIGYDKGDIFEVTASGEFGVEFVDNDGDSRYAKDKDKRYRVLERTGDAIEYDATPDILDMLANLARRVTSLESQLSATQRNAEMLAEELMALKYLTQSNEGDIRELNSRTQVLDAINKYYAEGSR